MASSGSAPRLGTAAFVGVVSTRVPLDQWGIVADELGAPMQLLWRHVGERTALALPGAVGLAPRVRRIGRIDAPVTAAALAVAGLVIGYRTATRNFGRFLIRTMLCIHVGWVELVWWAASRWRVLGRIAIMGFGCVAVLGLVGASSAVARAVPRTLLPATVAAEARQVLPARTSLAEAAPHLGEDDIVADLTLARPAVLVVAGAHVLYTDEDPLLHDREGRLAALTAIAT